MSSSTSSTIWLPRSRRAPVEARRRLSALLATVPGGERYWDSGALVVSELVANAVLHGTPPGCLVYLALDVDSVRLRVEVHDVRRDRRPVLVVPGLTVEAGRGLQLVKSLANKWGCCPREPRGKIVWCEVAE
ncbi:MULTISPECIES: ATP-binding protein [Streptomyces]|uniref:ATP-binding protein n=1 Tax=Streptomyces TaxID=1883 RepID=UPI0009968587|nr:MULTISPECIES: ATP-binding protein [Streptomyces]